MVKRFKLEPIHDNHNSFYNKAVVYEYEDKIYLNSYATTVACIDGNGFHRMWDGYSATSMRHINEFSMQFGDGNTGKAWWTSLEVEENI